MNEHFVLIVHLGDVAKYGRDSRLDDEEVKLTAQEALDAIESLGDRATKAENRVVLLEARILEVFNKTALLDWLLSEAPDA